MNNDGSRPYKAAVIGCGKIAGGYDLVPGSGWTVTHAGAYRACPATELVAAADPDLVALEDFGARWGIRSLYPGYREMLEAEKPDIVSLCLPAEGHFEAFQAACEAGARAIFLEKPVAAGPEEARVMPALAAGRPVAVNYFRRWNPTLLALKEEFAGGGCGRPLRVTVHYVKDLAGNASHFVDLLRWFFGEPEAVRTLRVFDEEGVGVAADFEIAFPKDVLATFLHVPSTGYVLHEVDIFTDRMRVVIGQRGQIVRRFESVEEPHAGLFRILESEGAARETEWRDCTLRAVGELVACLEGMGDLACGLGDGIRALEVCEAILAQTPPRVWATV